MKRIKRIALAVLAAAMLGGLMSCGKKDGESEDSKPIIKESQMKEIAELSTLECSFHNVAKYHRDNASGWWIFSKDKDFWIEYTGIVKIGIDISLIKFTIDGNDVTIGIPPAQIQSCKVDESSFNEGCFIVADGSAKPTANDTIEALKKAQADMLDTVSQDSKLLESARDRAKQLLEDYVKNIGKLSETEYNVIFVDISADDTGTPETTSPETENKQ